MTFWFLLIGSVAQKASVLPSRFDLSDVRSQIPAIDRPVDRNARYRVADPDGETPANGDTDDGISVKFRWNKVKLRVPI